MIKSLLLKLKEAAFSVLPVVLIVALIHMTPLTALTAHELAVFFACALLLVVGMALFGLGADIAMTPMGTHTGVGLVRSKKLSTLLVAAFVMGVLITVAEPDLTVLADQLKTAVSPTALVVCVSVGVGVFLVLAVLKTVFRRRLYEMLLYFYLTAFMLAALSLAKGGAFVAVGFDSGGVTTGPVTVPFIMALGVGIAASVGGKDAAENSFGTVAMCSVGPIIAVLLLSSFSGKKPEYSAPENVVAENFFKTLGSEILHTAKDVLLALLLVCAFFAIIQALRLKLPHKTLLKMAVGIGYTFVGLTLFLAAAKVGFMPVGEKLGRDMAQKSPALLAVFGFLLGAVAVLAEPAVHVLNRQVEEVTGGTVSKTAMMAALSIGVGLSVGLSMIRAALGFSVLYYLVPGYLISLGLSFFVPHMYTAIAFDSGGVASGPLTSSFILPMAIGACLTFWGEGGVLEGAFGVVAMVAMTPLITIQALGFRAILKARIREKSALKKITAADDCRIIDFVSGEVI